MDENFKVNEPESEFDRVEKNENPSSWRRFLRGEIRFALLQTIFLRLSLVVSLAIIIIFVWRELTDKSYRIEEFSLPEEFKKDGYTGAWVASQLLDEVNEMVEIANERRTLKEVEQYNQASDKVQIQVEFEGVGVSPDKIADYLRQILGFSSRKISGSIVKSGNDLKLTLRMSGKTKSVITQPVDSTGIYLSLNEVIRKSGEVVLRWNNPLLAGLYHYSSSDFEKAIQSFRESTFTQPQVMATSYAHWGDALLVQTKGDTIGASKMLHKALSIDPDNATAYRILGNMSGRNLIKKEAYYRKSLELDPTSAPTWFFLAYRVLRRDSNREEEALRCYQKSYNLDKTYTESLYQWIRLLYLKGQYESAYEKLQLLKYADPKNGNSLSIAISEALLDTAQAISIFESIKDKRGIGDGLNELAYSQELRKNYIIALRLAKLSVKADSTTQNAAGAFSTLAEVYGLTNQKNKFYLNLEKALKLGFELELAEEDEPYKSFVLEKQYQELKRNYKNGH